MTTRWDVERAVLGSALPAPARLIMMTLLTLTEDGGTTVPQRFTPSHNRLAALTGLSRATVIKHLGALEDAGWVLVRRADVTQQRAQKTPNRYALRVPTSARRGLEPTASSPRGAPVLVHDVDHETASTSPPRGHRSDLISRPNQISAREHEIDAAITEIRRRTGKTVAAEWAAQVIEHIIGDRTAITSRTGYLISAIRKEPKPHERFLPTPQPPPFRKDTRA